MRGYWSEPSLPRAEAGFKERIKSAVFGEKGGASPPFFLYSDDANLQDASFTNINLSGAKFTDINFSHAAIEECCIEGLMIWGYDIRALIQAEKARQANA